MLCKRLSHQRNIYSLFCQSFSWVLLLSPPPPSRFFNLLPWHRSEIVHCYYNNLIDPKYSISSLKAFIHRVATIHKICGNATVHCGKCRPMCLVWMSLKIVLKYFIQHLNDQRVVNVWTLQASKLLFDLFYLKSQFNISTALRKDLFIKITRKVALTACNLQDFCFILPKIEHCVLKCK